MQDSNNAGDDGLTHLDPRVIRVHEIGLGIFLGFLLLPILGGTVISAIAGPRTRWSTAAVTATVGVVAALILWALGRRWAHVSYRRTSYRISPRGLEIRRGVWWRQTVSVPRSRIQHTDVTQGPLQRGFELATLVLYTAGVQHAKIELDGLAFSTAMALREDLLEAAAAPAAPDSPRPAPPDPGIADPVVTPAAHDALTD